MSVKEAQLQFQLETAGLVGMEAATFVTEHRFHPTRRWRFDFAWPELLLAVEVEGGIWIRGGHSSGRGITRDVEKGNEAALLGWMVIRVTGDMIDDGTALATIERAMALRRAR